MPEAKKRRPVKPTTLDVCTTFHGTDTQFMRGTHLDDGFGTDNKTRQKVHAKARAQGINPTGMKWVPGLVPKGEQYSPDGLVNGRGDVVKRCQNKGWGCEGRINVKAVEPDEPGMHERQYEIADDLIAEDVDKIVKQEHGGKVSKKKREQLSDDCRTKAMPDSGNL